MSDSSSSSSKKSRKGSTDESTNQVYLTCDPIAKEVSITYPKGWDFTQPISQDNIEALFKNYCKFYNQQETSEAKIKFLLKLNTHYSNKQRKEKASSSKPELNTSEIKEEKIQSAPTSPKATTMSDADAVKATLDFLEDEINSTELEINKGTVDNPLKEEEVHLLKSSLDAHVIEAREVKKKIFLKITDNGVKTTLLARVNNLISNIQKHTITINSASINYETQRQKQMATATGTAAAALTSSSSIGRNVPEFSGNFAEFTSFIDLFDAQVNNQSIPECEKLAILKSKLKGVAHESVMNILISTGNYKSTYDSLKLTFSHPRTTAYLYLQNLMQHKFISEPSSSELLALHTRITSTTAALKALGVETDKWDLILVYCMRKKLNSSMKEEFDCQLGHKDIPKLQEFLDFVLNKAHSTIDKPKFTHRKESRDTASSSHQKQNYNNNNSSNEDQNSSKKFEKKNKKDKKTKQPCIYCEEDHFLAKCDEFKKLSYEAKKDFVNNKKLCSNCFYKNHSVNECTKKSYCSSCQDKHSSLLHPPDTKSKKKEVKTCWTKSSSQDINNQETQHDSSESEEEYYTNEDIIIPTVVVNLEDTHGKLHPIKFILDTADHINLITEQVSDLLKIERTASTLILRGVSSTFCGKTRGKITTYLHSIIKSWKKSYDFHIINSLEDSKKVNNQQYQTISQLEIPDEFTSLKLADPHFFKKNKIHGILSVNVFCDVILPRKIVPAKSSLIAMDSQLGYVIMGGKFNPVNTTATTCHTSVAVDFSKFCVQEEVPGEQIQTLEESFTENDYVKNNFRNVVGRYGVKLPFKPKHQEKLGESKKQALCRLYSLLKKLAQDKNQMDKVNQLIAEMKEKNIIRLVKVNSKVDEETRYFLPYHCVYKQSTGKMRIVFDASATTTSGFSLNDVLANGPTIQQPITSTLMNFREHKYVFTCDIESMYHQILIHEDDKKYLSFLVKEDGKINTYEFNRLPFGVKPAPYLAVRTLHKLASDYNEEYPNAAKSVKKFYMDDGMLGDKTIEETKLLREETVNLFNEGCFNLSKFSSNSAEVLHGLEESKIEAQSKSLEQENSEETVKTLGVIWNPSEDVFLFIILVPLFNSNKKFTKREVASMLLKLFDPLGFLQPVIVIAKFILQNIWLIKSSKVGENNNKDDWDQPIPEDLNQEFIQYLHELPLLQQIKIKRQVVLNTNSQFELHGFADSSTKALGAVVYLREKVTDQEYNVSLLMSKTKLIHKNQINSKNKNQDIIARLELEAALILIQLVFHVKESLDIKIENTFYWSDNATVLHWLSHSPLKWKMYIANRVEKIQKLSTRPQWNYIKSEENPADIISRGIKPSELINNDLWWKAPKWLSTATLKIIPTPGTIEYVKLKESEPKQKKKKQKKVKKSSSASVLSTKPEPDSQIINYEDYSEYNILIKKTVWILRAKKKFLKCLQKNEELNINSNLNIITATEIVEAEKFWIEKIQNEHFSDVIQDIKNNKAIKDKTLRKLSLFIDADNILRVGGRLKKSNLPYNQKHQILLPNTSHFTSILIMKSHRTCHHAAQQYLHNYMFQNYWLLNPIKTIKKSISKCLICIKMKAKSQQQLMGELPAERTQPSHPFQFVGVDYAGPFKLKCEVGRNTRKSSVNKEYKSYVVVFVCLSTTAVHLELVSNATSENFISALRRFISRRGKPSKIFSDCGTNIIGGENEIEKMYLSRDMAEQLKVTVNNNEVEKELINNKIQWVKNPPFTPHMGGLWEAAVKSFKFHFKRIVADKKLSYEEFNTILCEIEALLNSRPLTKLSSDPEDHLPLTPFHFILGRSFESLPEVDLSSIKSNQLDSWQQLQKLKADFWRSWTMEYLHQMQQRNKWDKKEDNLKVGEIVLLMEESSSPLKWPLVRVTKTFPGDDGLVRKVEVQTSSGSVYLRSTSKLVKLPFDQ